MIEIPRHRASQPTPCGHASGCTEPATHQAPRDATDAEAAAYFDATEQNIRASGTPEYVHDRSGPVTIADFRCSHPDHAHPDYLAALENETASDG
jgi:hypothetical protein